MAARPLCVADLEQAARAVLPGPVWDFVAGGSGTESALAENRRALDAIALVPRVGTGIASADTGTGLLGVPSAMPVAVAPMAYHQMLHPDGELATARAARAAGVPLVVSVLSGLPLADVAAVGADVWLQLYWLRDEGRLDEILGIAAAAGYSGVMVTADTPVMARRLRDLRNGFTLPPGIGPVNLSSSSGPVPQGRAGVSALAEHTAAAFSPSFSWALLEQLCGRTSLPVAIKGVLDPRDARAAVAAGARTVVVSNHGGRQFDGAVAAVTALPEVVEEVGDEAEVLLDSGIRSGLDVLRALALGASGVLLGRPALWGLAAGGAPGVERVLGLLRTELSEAMLLAGAADVTAAARLRTRIRGYDR
ncbi:alpha-hydroxy acid oxidase [Actinoplanes sp. NPDC051861]|uniref:alpha-hydroxy acid oxidase n=1 Tax=Actinoplanes sp. NPDC051861 TaxID=3155170 RepID=UPI00342E86B7